MLINQNAPPRLINNADLQCVRAIHLSASYGTDSSNRVLGDGLQLDLRVLSMVYDSTLSVYETINVG